MKNKQTNKKNELHSSVTSFFIFNGWTLSQVWLRFLCPRSWGICRNANLFCILHSSSRRILVLGLISPLIIFVYFFWPRTNCLEKYLRCELTMVEIEWRLSVLGNCYISILFWEREKNWRINFSIVACNH